MGDTSGSSGSADKRAQSHVVGVALMLGLAVIALGTLTVGIASLVDSQAASADAERVADGFDRAIQGAERTGHHSHRVSFSEGRLQSEDRTLRILDGGSVIESRAVEALVFDNDEYRIVANAGAVLRESSTGTALVSEPSITASEQNEVVLVSAPVLNTSHVSIGGQGGISRSIETNVSHSRTDLGTGDFAVAIETASTDAFVRYFDDRGIQTTVRQFQDDEYASIVATFPGERQGYLVTHDLRLEVRP